MSSGSSLTRGIIKYSLDRIFENRKSKTYHLIDDGFLSRQVNKFPMKEFQDNDTVFMRGQKPKFFFYVESGKVELINKLERLIAEFHPGDSFGEMALFNETLRTTKAKVVGTTVLHLVSADFIKSFFENEDVFLKFIVLSIFERLNAMNKLRNLIV
jgi:CRP-like cAMP-binding protein